MIVARENVVVAQGLMRRLKGEYKMSQRDIAAWCGTTQPMVTWWATGRHNINDEHLDRLREALVLLAGRNIRYKGQALDILMGEE